ncbi:MAG: SDR family NAD(P)-dependent oxidoreductase [Bacteroidales bacterium]|nr:SDR family NAD(P)-dependent oxidoreductase [Bacteroidales bacterium]
MNIWITGASSGIGQATAWEFAREGHCLILTSRESANLDFTAMECTRLGAKGVKVLPFDLSCADGLETLAEEAWKAFEGGIDILFCNAGQSQRTKVLDTDEAVLRRIMELNYFTPALLSKAVLAKMLARTESRRTISGKPVKGQIAVTTSINGRFGFPLRCGYSSAKHACYGFFETLAAEYYKEGIRVTIVCPGRVQTNISLHALEKGGKEHGAMDPGQAKGLSCEKAGKKIFKALMKGKSEVLVGKGELIMVYIKRFFPYICSVISRNIKSM